MFKKQVGSALITALFIMTLITIAATAMTMRLQVDIYRTRLTLNTDKLHFASQLVLFWAIDELNNKKNTFSVADTQGKVAEFPAKFSASYPAFKLTGALYDLQSRFNVNNASDPNYFLTIVRVFDAPKINLDKNAIKELIRTINLWVSTYQPGHDKDETLAYYLKQNPPYLPAHQALQNLSEFRLLQGVTANLYNVLAPRLSALPEITPLNINTMPVSLLPSLGYGLNESQVDTILQKRGAEGITRPEKLSALLKRLNIRPEQVTIASQYFLSVATVQYEDTSLTSYSLLKRNSDKHKKLSVSVLNESLNTP